MQIKFFDNLCLYIYNFFIWVWISNRTSSIPYLPVLNWTKLNFSTGRYLFIPKKAIDEHRSATLISIQTGTEYLGWYWWGCWCSSSGQRPPCWTNVAAPRRRQSSPGQNLSQFQVLMSKISDKNQDLPLYIFLFWRLKSRVRIENFPPDP